MATNEARGGSTALAPGGQRPGGPPGDPGSPRGRAASPGWVLLPQRIFLGVTFTFAGLQKLADPNFFDADIPTSIQGQLAIFRETSPIRVLLGPVASHAVLFGVVISLAEIAVGLGTLLGLWTRLAALGGALLSLSFLLTVSWGTRPYYYGSDIVFLVAWLPLIWVGAAGVLSLDAVLARRRAGPQSSEGGVAPRRVGPIDRRAAVATGLLGLGVLVIAGADAALGRALGRNRTGRRAAVAPPTRAGSSPSGSPSAGGGSSGTPVGAVSALPVGGVLAFTEPSTGLPAYVVQPAAGRFLAFSAICTHTGCTVQFQGSSRRFHCPCHNSNFDGATGDVQNGPATRALRRIPVSAVGGELRVGN